MNDVTSPAVGTVHHCRRCGRVLTDPRSIARGYGRTCARRMSAALVHIGATYSPGQIAAATALIDDGGLLVGPHGTCLAVSSDGTTTYVVDPRRGSCTCKAGQNGRACYHLASATALVAPVLPARVAVAV